MKLTSAEAAKQLRLLTEELEGIQRSEELSMEYNAALGEDPTAVRPEYDFAKTQTRIAELHTRIRKLKHAINVFNATTVVPGFDMTIDEMLVYLPQLSRLKYKLSDMSSKLPKERVSASGKGASLIIDYRYLNYDVRQAEAEFKRVSELLAKAQTALDVANTTIPFEADF